VLHITILLSDVHVARWQLGMWISIDWYIDWYWHISL